MKIKPSNERMKYALAKIRHGEVVYSKFDGKEDGAGFILPLFYVMVAVPFLVALVWLLPPENRTTDPATIGVLYSILQIPILCAFLVLSRQALTYEEFKAMQQHKIEKDHPILDKSFDVLEKTFDKTVSFFDRVLPRKEKFISEFENEHKVSKKEK